MKRLIGACALLVVGCTGPAPAPVPFGATIGDVIPAAKPAVELSTGGGAAASPADYRPMEAVVTLRDGADAQALASWLGATVTGQVAFSSSHVRLRLDPGGEVAAALASLSLRPEVLVAEPNWVATASYLASSQTPSDALYASQWAHAATGMLNAWRALGSSFTASSVAIAVLDTGCDRLHPEFGDRVLVGQNFTSDHPDSRVAISLDVTDENGHGTHVAGIAAAGGNDTMGVAGVAWDARVLPLKVLGKTGGDSFSILQAIRYAADYADGGVRVRVINLSLGTAGVTTSDAAYEDAMTYAAAKGVVVVCAAGNQAGPVILPATNPHALVVSSTSAYRVSGALLGEYFSGFSNRGARVEVAAPGGEILSCLPRNDNDNSRSIGLTTRAIGDDSSAIDPPYGTLSGTSMAAPYVSGVVALLAARYDPLHQRLNADFSQKVRDRLAATAHDMGNPGRDPSFGWGRIDPTAALAPASL